MHIQKIVLALWFCLSFATAGVMAEEEPLPQGVWTDYSGAPEVELEREEDGGIAIHKDLKLKIEKDRKVVKVGSNVLRPQERQEYVNDRLKKMDARLALHEAAYKKFEERLEKLEKAQKKAQEEESSIVYA